MNDLKESPAPGPMQKSAHLREFLPDSRTIHQGMPYKSNSDFAGCSINHLTQILVLQES